MLHVACVYNSAALLVRNGAHAALRRQYERALHYARHAVFIQAGYKRLANAKFHYCRLRIERGICAECMRGGFYSLLFAWRICPERMLHAV